MSKETNTNFKGIFIPIEILNIDNTKLSVQRKMILSYVTFRLDLKDYEWEFSQADTCQTLNIDRKVTSIFFKELTDVKVFNFIRTEIKNGHVTKIYKANPIELANYIKSLVSIKTTHVSIKTTHVSIKTTDVSIKTTIESISTHYKKEDNKEDKKENNIDNKKEENCIISNGKLEVVKETVDNEMTDDWFEKLKKDISNSPTLPVIPIKSVESVSETNNDWDRL